MQPATGAIVTGRKSPTFRRNWTSSTPKRAREAATELVGAAKEAEPSLGMRLLADLKIVFDKRGEDKLATSVILAALIALPESPWGDLKGKPITDRALATRLRQYSIKSRDIFVAGKGLKGYYREDLHDAWLRYLSPSPPQSDEGDDPPEMAGFRTTSIALIADNMRDELPECDENTSMQSSNLADIAPIADAQGGGEEKANNTSPDDPDFLPHGRRCDHCGGELGIMNSWEWPDRADGIWLHQRCEGPWFDSEGRPK